MLIQNGLKIDQNRPKLYDMVQNGNFWPVENKSYPSKWPAWQVLAKALLCIVYGVVTCLEVVLLIIKESITIMLYTIICTEETLQWDESWPSPLTVMESTCRVEYNDYKGVGKDPSYCRTLPIAGSCNNYEFKFVSTDRTDTPVDYKFLWYTTLTFLITETEELKFLTYRIVFVITKQQQHPL